MLHSLAIIKKIILIHFTYFIAYFLHTWQQQKNALKIKKEDREYEE